MQQRIQQYRSRLDSAWNRIEFLRGKVHSLASRGKQNEEYRDAALHDVEIFSKVVSLFQSISVEREQHFKDSLQSIVSYGLTAVFDEPLEFLVEIKARGKSRVVNFSVLDAHGVESSLLDSRGGGLVATTAFLLRVAVLVMLRRTHRQLLVLDEPVGQLSAQYIANFSQLVQELSKDLGIQFVLVTHQYSLANAADAIFTVQKDGSVGSVG